MRFKFYELSENHSGLVSFDVEPSNSLRWIGLNNSEDTSIEDSIYFPGGEYLSDTEEILADARRYLMTALVPPGCLSYQATINEQAPYKIYGRYEDRDIGAAMFYSDMDGIPVVYLTCGPDIYLPPSKSFSRRHLVPFTQMIEDSLNYLRSGVVPADSVEIKNS